MGVMVPDPETVIPWAKSEGLSHDMCELCKSSVCIHMYFS